MSKSPITWLELIKEKLNDAKKKGKSPSIGDVVPEAKKEWVQVKNGTHPKYTQGKAKTHARKGNKSSKKSNAKTKKNSAKSTPSPNMNIHDILDKAKVCKKCRKNIEKSMKKSDMKSGGSGTGDCGCGGKLAGGCGAMCVY